MRRAQEDHIQNTNTNANSKNQSNILQRRESRICRALCCSSNTRFSVSSSSSSERFSDQHGGGGSLSSLTHYMVQEKLDQMIRERQEATHQEKITQRRRRTRTRTRSGGGRNTKFIVMMAMEKYSYDPREDFRDSMVEMIISNRISDADELRSLLEYYLSMNPLDHRPVILEIFYEVCSDLFLCP
ncbi:PREDICTED: probable transcription repressor OFP9 [Tarenaya hassleriana]|uniref:probable transcription repressor OFP9 n=1 Tax=Tarenaya hassleriana TaxID=28532 RepID=UPI00053C4D26|nr:PREDICTED: probable transcription repressor OFP9 [Tarenaya hassleriana]